MRRAAARAVLEAARARGVAGWDPGARSTARRAVALEGAAAARAAVAAAAAARRRPDPPALRSSARSSSFSRERTRCAFLARTRAGVLSRRATPSSVMSEDDFSLLP